MKKNILGLIGIAIVAIVFVAYNTLFTVNQVEQALVLQFGEPKRVIREPGLKVKLPFIQNVIFYDSRILDYDPPSEEVIAADQKRLVVATYTRFRIVDPLRFYQTVQTERGVRNRLNALVSAALRRVIGGVTLVSVLSEERDQLMKKIRDEVNNEASAFGIAVIDVRIRRADLPAQNSQAIYARMKSEREREAAEFRAQGAELSQRIKSRADRERTVILAEAEKNAQILRGQGDNQANKIYAEAYSKDTKFFAFYRTMLSYTRALAGDDTTFVLSPDSEFFRFFGTAKDKPAVVGK